MGVDGAGQVEGMGQAMSTIRPSTDWKVKNAVIESARITNDDHGLLSAWLTLDYGGRGQGFGRFPLFLPSSYKHPQVSRSNYAGHFIWRVMEVAGVSEWSDLPGKTIRVRCEHSKVHA